MHTYLKSTDTGLEIIESQTKIPEREDYQTSKGRDIKFGDGELCFDYALRWWFSTAKRTPVDKGSEEGFKLYALSIIGWDKFNDKALQQGVKINEECVEIKYICEINGDSEWRAFFKSPQKKEECQESLIKKCFMDADKYCYDNGYNPNQMININEDFSNPSGRGIHLSSLLGNFLSDYKLNNK